MRHKNAGRKFSRTHEHRRSMFRNLATNLIEHDRIITTVEKAKDLRRVVEKIITSARADTLAARRIAYGYLMNKPAVTKLFSVVAPSFKTRPGGYTRITKLGVRPGDSAAMAVIELIDQGSATSNATSKSATAKGAAADGKKSSKEAASQKPAKKTSKAA